MDDQGRDADERRGEVITLAKRPARLAGAGTVNLQAQASHRAHDRCELVQPLKADAVGFSDAPSQVTDVSFLPDDD